VEIWHSSRSRRSLPLGYGLCSDKIGWCTRNAPSVAPNMFSNIWAATLIAWLSPIIVRSRLPMAKSLFAGAIRPTTTNRNSCPYRLTSSCAAPAAYPGARLHAHPQLRLSSQPAACHSPTALLSPSRLRTTTESQTNVSSTKDSSDPWHCPKCGGPMKVVERLTAAEIQLRSPPTVTVAA
jgi:hypothetical protein